MSNIKTQHLIDSLQMHLESRDRALNSLHLIIQEQTEENKELREARREATALSEHLTCVIAKLLSDVEKFQKDTEEQKQHIKSLKARLKYTVNNSSTTWTGDCDA